LSKCVEAERCLERIQPRAGNARIAGQLDGEDIDQGDIVLIAAIIIGDWYTSTYREANLMKM